MAIKTLTVTVTYEECEDARGYNPEFVQEVISASIHRAMSGRVVVYEGSRLKQVFARITGITRERGED